MPDDVTISYFPKRSKTKAKSTSHLSAWSLSNPEDEFVGEDAEKFGSLVRCGREWKVKSVEVP